MRTKTPHIPSPPPHYIKLIIIYFTFLHAFSAWAQSESCGFDTFIQSVIQQDPTYQVEIDAFDQMIADGTATCLPLGNYEIPVVVHIMHNNGPEYILDAQVHAAIDQLNQQFAGGDGGHNTNIQFALAQIDPTGNCTSGIIRVQTDNPFGYLGNAEADIGMKALSLWPTENYLNIWIVRCTYSNPTTCGNNAYATTPTTNINGFYRDGVVIPHNKFGNAGTAATNTSNTITHEVGHYLSLYHPWGPTTESGCAARCHSSADDLTHGDRVPDTNPCFDQLNVSDCSLPYPNQCFDACDVATGAYPKENYMSYTWNCQIGFTEDQTARMYCALNESRTNLWLESNKACTGLNTYEPWSENSSAWALDYQGRWVLTEDEVWSVDNLPNTGDVTIMESFGVGSGAKLTIEEGVTVRFCAGKRLIVKPNAHLYLEGTLTNNCGEPWKGVEVWGSNDNILEPPNSLVNTSQYPSNGIYAQGLISCRQGALIENAEVGIQLWGENDNETGGRISATFATFSNNEVAIEFKPYHNYYPYSIPPRYHLRPRNYAAYITRCTFTTDDDYQFTDDIHLQRDPFDAFIKMSGVDGVGIYGSSFTNTQSLPDASITPDYGYGILAINSGFRLYPHCPSQFSCTYTSSTFEGLGYGIYTGNTNLSRPYTVKEAVFTDCFVGIHNSAVSNGTMISNIFNMGTVPDPAITTEQVGVMFENNIAGFTFEENRFEGTLGNTTTTIGTICKNIGESNNIIRRNHYDNLSYGNLANGYNASAYNPFLPERGLSYLCNINNNMSQYDFALPDNAGLDFIRHSQGLESEADDGSIVYDAAGNHFSHNAVDFLNDGEGTVDYYYFAGDSEQVPLNHSGIDLIETFDNTCPVTYCEPPCVDSDGLEGIKDNFYNSQSNELTAIIQIQVALDAGNTSLAMQHEREAAYYKQRMDRDAFMVVLHVLHDTLTFDPDTLDVWIENLDVLGMDLFFALKSQSEGKTGKAQASMQKALNRQGLSKSQNDDLADMSELLQVLENKSPYQLEKPDLKELKKLSEKDESFVGNIARNILTMYGHRFPVTYRLPERRETNTPTTLLSTRNLMIYPNPNSGLFNILWTPRNEVLQRAAVLNIMDVNGKIIRTMDVNAKEQYQLDLDVPKGIYFYQLNVIDGITESGKFIIQ